MGCWPAPLKCPLRGKLRRLGIESSELHVDSGELGCWNENSRTKNKHASAMMLMMRPTRFCCVASGSPCLGSEWNVGRACDRESVAPLWVCGWRTLPVISCRPRSQGHTLLGCLGRRLCSFSQFASSSLDASFVSCHA